MSRKLRLQRTALRPVQAVSIRAMSCEAGALTATACASFAVEHVQR
jgi:hypothetical protein